MWSITVRCRGCTITSDGGWLLETHRICLKIPGHCWKALLSTGQGGAGHHFWCETLPPVRLWVIMSDHRPLMHLLSPSKATPVMTFVRLQQWALILGAYDCKIAYKAGEDHSNADALSHLSLQNNALSCSHTPRDNPSDGTLVHGSSISCPNLATDRSSSTPGQGETVCTARLAWPHGSGTEGTSPYWRRRDELSL